MEISFSEVHKNEDHTRTGKWGRRMLISLSLSLVLASSAFALCTSLSIAQGGVFELPKGSSALTVVTKMEEEGYLNPSPCSRFLVRFSPNVKSGFYALEEGEKFAHVLERFESGEYGAVYHWVTFLEGATVRDYGEILEREGFIQNGTEFARRYREKEGMLFPDTYAFFPDTREDEIVRRLEERFREQWARAKEGTFLSVSDRDALIMASLIEKEAGKSLEEKRTISGILWKRLRSGMPLQVDAPFLYERGKTSAQLRRSDLTRDSAYNTYTRKGLPASPIGNPGYDAMYAAWHPIESPYWYYLHDAQGRIHYAHTHAEHLKNKRLYLQ